MKHRSFPIASLIALVVLMVGTASADPVDDVGPSKAQRDTVLQRVAAARRLDFQSVAARLRLGVDTALAWRQLDTLLMKPTGDIFWMYPAAGFYFNCREMLSPAWRARFRATWKSYTPYRGDTENHFLMYYSALLLFSQEWPEMKGSEWFNGKSSAENYREAKGYLDHWIDETARYGTTEWDSPRYLYYYLTPLIILRDFTRDTTLRLRFEMMLEYQLADFAADYLEGFYTGAHARDGDGSVIDPRRAEMTSYAGLYLEDSVGTVLNDLAFAAMSDFRCPQIIRDIAHDRATPFVHREVKRSRAKMRYSDSAYTPVLKYTYMTPSYAIGSIQGGIQQPIQQHTWDVTFAANRPNNTFFALHPQASELELGMFFPEEPSLMGEGVIRSKASYGNENKWIGGSPYEQVFQYRSTLIGIYDIPAGKQFQHVDLFVPKSADTIIRHPSGWIVCRMEEAFAAVRPVTLPDSAEWTEETVNWRLRLKGSHRIDYSRGSAVPVVRHSYIVECGSAREMSLDTFVQRLARVGREPLVEELTSTLNHHTRETISTLDRITYISPFNGDIHIVFAKHWVNAEQSVPMILGTRPMSSTEDGNPPDRRPAMLFSGPHLSSTIGSGVLEMRYNGRYRILDFVRNMVR